MKTGFFSALWGVCNRTSIFPQLLGNSRTRAVWHLFLMSLLCTVLVSLRMFPLLRGEWNGVAKRYVEVFGKQLEFSAAGIRPEEKPDESRSMELPMSGTLVYTARESDVVIPAGELSTANYLVLWSSRFIAIAVRIDAKHWDVQLMRPRQPIDRRRMDRDSLAGYFAAELKRPPNSGEKWSLYEFQLEAEEVFRLFSTITAAGWFIYDWLSNFLLGLVCTGFFALLARLTGAATARGLTGWQYWQVGIYAGFPGMLIGGIIAILDLFPGYNIAYSLALIIYWLPAALACSKEHRDGGDGAPPAA